MSTKNAKILEIVAGSAAVRKAIAEQDALVLERRKFLSSEISCLDRQASRDFPKMEAAVADALAAAREAEKALKDANHKLALAANAKTNASFNYGNMRDELERELRATSNPALTEFIAAMRDATQETRKGFRVEHEVVERNPITGAVKRTQASNAAEVNRRLAAIDEAMQAAQDMALDPDQSSVPNKLAKLKAGLPALSPVAASDEGITKPEGRCAVRKA
jgi:hypothetical protein